MHKLTEDNSIIIKKDIEKLISKFKYEIPRLKKGIEMWIENSGNINEMAYKVANVPLFLRLSLLDTSILFHHLLKSNLEIEINLFARLVSSQLYEFIKDVLKIFGKDFRVLLSQFPNNENLIKELNFLIKVMNDIKEAYINFFKTVRNNIAAHKDYDSIIQTRLIEKLDIDIVMVAYMNIIGWFSDYYNFEQKIFEIALVTKKMP